MIERRPLDSFLGFEMLKRQCCFIEQRRDATCRGLGKLVATVAEIDRDGAVAENRRIDGTNQPSAPALGVEDSGRGSRMGGDQFSRLAPYVFRNADMDMQLIVR